MKGIPELDAEGLLPVGIWDCTMEEIKERFGVFRSTDHRCRLFDKLEAYVGDIRAANLGVAVIVDGSFVTGKPEPDDIDVILVLREGSVNRPLRPFEYNVVSATLVRHKYALDARAATAGSDGYHDRLAFFHQVKGRPGLQKGLLRVSL